MLDQLRKPPEPCFFPHGRDDPIGARPLVPRGLRAEEFPSGFVGTKQLFLFTGEAGVLSLFIRVDAGFFFVASGESLETGGTHQALLCEISYQINVDGTPGAGGLAGSEANCVAGFV